MKRLGRTISGAAALLIAAGCGWPTEARGQAICGNSNALGTAQGPRESDGARNTDFVRIDLLSLEHAVADDASKPNLVSLDSDVLWPSGAAARGDVSLRTSGLRIRSLVCIRHKPEMLGLAIQNVGHALSDSRIRVEVVHGETTDVLFGRLLSMEAGETREFLFSASIPLGSARTMAIHVGPKRSRQSP